MIRLEWLIFALAILQVAHILQAATARQQQKQAHKELMDLLSIFATMVGEMFPYLKVLIGKG